MPTRSSKMPRTKSTFTTFSFPEPVPFVIDLSIPKISALKSSNTLISSDEMILGPDSSWTVNVFTAKKVKTQEKEDNFIAVHVRQRMLRQCDEKARTHIVMTISIVDPSTNRVNPHFSTKKSCVLTATTSYMSSLVLFKHSDIWNPESKLILQNDTLEIRAEILREHCRDIYESDLGCDFELVSSDGVKLRVHKAFLSSASPVFHRMFESNLKECATGRCVISDVDTRILEILLKYMYYGSVEVSPDHAKAVLVAADKYELEPLKEHCEEMMSGTIKTENVAEILLFADQMSASNLKQAALQYMADNRDETLNSAETDAVFGSSDPKLVKEVFAAMLKSPPAKRSHDQVDP